MPPTSFTVYEDEEPTSALELITVDEIRARFEKQGGVGLVSLQYLFVKLVRHYYSAPTLPPRSSLTCLNL